jgi:hypothetical protein
MGKPKSKLSTLHSYKCSFHSHLHRPLRCVSLYSTLCVALPAPFGGAKQIGPWTLDEVKTRLRNARERAASTRYRKLEGEQLDRDNKSSTVKTSWTDCIYPVISCIVLFLLGIVYPYLVY